MPTFPHSGARFLTTLTGDEHFVVRGPVDGPRLPPMAVLEMLLAAGMQKLPAEGGAHLLSKVEWPEPVVFSGQSVDLETRLDPVIGDPAVSEVTAGSVVGGRRQLHGRAQLCVRELADRPVLDIRRLSDLPANRNVSKADFYTQGGAPGQDYGPGHAVVQHVAIGSDPMGPWAVAQLALPPELAPTAGIFAMHPHLLEGALQIAGALEGLDARCLPLAVDEVEVFGRVPSEVWAWVRPSAGEGSLGPVRRLDVDLCEDDGRVCVSLRGFTTRVMEVDIRPNRARVRLSERSWRAAVAAGGEVTAPGGHWVVLCGSMGRHEAAVAAALPQARRLVLAADDGIATSYETGVQQLLSQVQALLQDRPKEPVLIQVARPTRGPEELFEGLSGLLRTARLENPGLMGQVIGLDPSEPSSSIVAKLQENGALASDVEVRYAHGERQVATWSPLPEAAGAPPWRDGGVYLITGGVGGLGLIFAREIATRTRGARLILTSRSALSDEAAASITEIEALGAQVEHRTADVSDGSAVTALVSQIVSAHGGLNGILHGAGVIRDSFLVKKTPQEAAAVLSPKVTGLVNLDEATRDLNLDLVVLFGSGAGALGNVGQADYAAANRFMETYASYRNALAAGGARHGRTISLSWPLWREGGMQVGEALEQLMAEQGLAPMPTEAGLQAFYDALAAGADQILVAYGQHHASIPTPPTALRANFKPSWPRQDQERLLLRTQERLRDLFAELLNLDRSQIHMDEAFEVYGVNSLMITQMNHRLAGVFGELPKTLFFEHETLEALAEYLAREHLEGCLAFAGLAAEFVPLVRSEVAPDAALTAPPGAQIRATAVAAAATIAVAPRPAEPAVPPTREGGSIAIIGLSGRYPGAATLDAYWENLSAGRDSVGEVPAERWPLDGFYEPDADRAVAEGKSYSKWGGFIDGFNEFDPLFFGISPAQAENMDPQERLFLQCAHATLEDAGYSRQSLSELYRGRVGVFAGITTTGFNLYGPELRRRNQPSLPQTSFSSVANRVSYVFDLHGPSMPIDTMCSASLTAIHEACVHLRQGSCDLAIAGGVNLYVHPSSYVVRSAQRMLSPEGQCRSFGAGGDGYVPGEGVGAVVLKPLSAALADGDQIYGVIRGSAVNHGGRTNGYTVPSPQAQAQVVEQALASAGITPRAVSYIEAHGTGTSLGDPIEIAGLTRAFGMPASAGQYCAIGSVKSNIGHCESAAGIAGLTKVLLQMRHGTLVKSLHSETLNPNIAFEQTPFQVQQETAAWPRPQFEVDGVLREHPRIAGISSFGAGGANVHLVVEEAPSPPPEVWSGPVVVVLSARTPEGLKEQVRQLDEALEDLTEAELGRVAWTLQTGREAMEHRLAVVAQSLGELRAKLAAYAAGERADELYQGEVRRNREALAVFSADEDLQQAVAAWMAKGKLSKLAELWVRGLPVTWRDLYGGSVPRRLSLPTYPFARERYWVEPAAGPAQGAPAGAAPRRGLLLLEEAWLPEPAVAPDPLEGLVVCFLSDVAKREAMNASLSAIGSRVIFVAQSGQGDGLGLEVSAEDLAGQARILEAIVAEHGAIGSLLYLWPLEDAGLAGRPETVLGLLSSLVRVGLDTRLVLAGAGRAQDLAAMETWIGMGRSLGLVAPSLRTTVILEARGRRTQTDWDAAVWSSRLVEEIGRGSGSVLYAEGERLVSRVRPVALEAGRDRLRKGGVYLITGGAGGLGLIFSRWLAQTYGARLVLTGRSPLDEGLRAQIETLSALGGEAVYVEADVTDAAALRSAVCLAVERFGPLDGVLHAAGVESKGGLLDRNEPQIAQVLGPKVSGTLALDAAVSDQPLDFMCYFSSSAGVLGDFGACDYAAANRFLMAHARARNAQVERGEAQGQSVAICWPLWADGGMGQADKEQTRLYLRSSGQQALATSEGLELFGRILAAGVEQALVLSGDTARLEQAAERAVTGPGRAVAAEASPSRTVVLPGHIAPAGLNLAQAVAWELREEAAQLLRMDREQLDPDSNLADFGFDSVGFTKFAKLLSGLYGVEILPSVFFSHSTLKTLSDHILSVHEAALQRRLLPERQAHDTRPVSLPPTPSPPPPPERASPSLVARPLVANEPIAIIGMSGRFPQARNVEALWSVLSKGIDAVTEIPAERFDWRAHYGDPQKEPGKGECRWGGTLPDVAEFDPLFFEISPREAQQIDPRQRLLLQEAWGALEDAGYGAAALEGGRIGTFVGVEQGDYHQLGGGGGVTANHEGVLAARLAYFLNLRGPTMAINTACSSGLVALHQACLSLRNDECDTALAAGVTLLLTPQAFIEMSRAGMLSKTGRCRTFDRSADGMTPGEAVAVVVLKRLSRAQADGDPIHAVIRGSGINYDGRTNGITAPSGVSQTRLLKDVYDRHGIDPREIGHVVAHGTGTRLGDPVEVNALHDTFRNYTSETGFCALTSTKTNFGHTLAASGLVSLIGLVQGLRHEAIPPSLHLETENEFINWRDSPFYVNRTLRAWPRSAGRRLGAVSAFGMSGTNAHVVVEGYDPSPRPTTAANPVLLVLSAKTAAALEERVQALLRLLEQGDWDGESLSAMSHTLLNGRLHFAHRCALVAADAAEAAVLLRGWRPGLARAGVIEGRVPREFAAEPVRQTQGETWLAQAANPAERRAALAGLAGLYSQGYVFGWRDLYGGAVPRRLSLPTYPFARERYWVEPAAGPAQGAPAGAGRLHPLLHANTSDLSEQRFSSWFTGEEPVLRDHVVVDRRILPGVAHLEMARAAVRAASGRQEAAAGLRLEQVVFARPVVVGPEGLELHIGLEARADGTIGYEIYSETQGEAVVHSQGRAVLGDVGPVLGVDLAQLRAQCGASLEGAACYEVFDGAGLHYGPQFRSLVRLWSGRAADGSRLALGELQLPGSALEGYDLHPGLMDGALQTSLGLMDDSAPGAGPGLPFALERVDLLRPLGGKAWALARYSAGSGPQSPAPKLDIDILDEAGEVCVRLQGFASRKLAAPAHSPLTDQVHIQDDTQTLLMRPLWTAQTAEPGAQLEGPRWVVLCEMGPQAEAAVRAQSPDVRCVALGSSALEVAGRYTDYAVQLLGVAREILETRTSQEVLVQLAIPAAGEGALHRGLGGLLRSAARENPRLRVQVLACEADLDGELLADRLQVEAGTKAQDLLYRQGQRHVLKLEEVG